MVDSVEEEDESRGIDAVIMIGDMVIQIDYAGTAPEFGLTREPFKQKRKHSSFRHIGYFATLEGLFGALKRLAPAGRTSVPA